MLKIRLQRIGKKHEPVFRVVVGRSQNGPKSGKFIEVLGSYDPRDKNANTLNKERVQAWIAQGAQVSDTVHNLLVSEKVIDKKKVNALPKKTAPKKDVVAEEASAAPIAEETAQEVVETPVEETPAEEVATPEVVAVEAPAAEEAPAEEVTPEAEAPAEAEETPEGTKSE
jgi:small subunit ribosomal protein S16